MKTQEEWIGCMQMLGLNQINEENSTLEIERTSQPSGPEKTL